MFNEKANSWWNSLYFDEQHLFINMVFNLNVSDMNIYGIDIDEDGDYIKMK